MTNETRDDLDQPVPAPAAQVEESPADDSIDVDPVEDYEHEDQAEAEDAPSGIPAGHLAAGGMTGGTVLLGTLYQLTGVAGLVAGGVLAGGGAVAYIRHRRGRGRAQTGTGWAAGSGSRSSGGKTASAAGGLFGGRKAAGKSASALFSTGASGSARSGKAGASRASRPAAGATPAGRASASRPGQSGRAAGGRAAGGSTAARATGKNASRNGSAVGAVRKQAASVGQATRAAARKSAAAAKTVTGGARRAASWGDRKSGGRAARAARAGRAAARAAAIGARKAAVWADRKTGRRVSAGYRAATTGTDRSFRARRRRAAAVLGWHGPVTGPVMALVALLTEAWRRRKARKGEAEKDDGAEASEAGAGAETSTDKPLADGDHALAASVACPRCGAKVKGTIPADEEDVWVTCACGFKIRFYRKPNDPPDNWDDAAGPADRPITASATCVGCGARHTATIPAGQGGQSVICPCGTELLFLRKQPGESPAASTATGRDRHRHPFTASSTYTRRNRTMSANPLAAAAAELNAAAAAHAPVDMFQVARELDQLPEIPANVGMALRTYTVRLQGEYPIDPAVVEALGALYMAHAQLVAQAEEIGALFRRAHAEDLKREEAPRTNEAAWNV
ncbi:hypothetical protein MTP10_40925 [Nonomuraea sp. 3-1Str]|uniref:hypothetical protein n=1 Tax=Nonomuraea sp. 3-1Str TaxID=2929801 RepID=UPI00285BA2A7|nr:hypothetical protein [Nonomuraea sp. 3-1Str]MDR8415082.1 hypothetical protein [Nonomuraea sp. 3-1Str]